jgi:hypothetical protein
VYLFDNCIPPNVIVFHSYITLLIQILNKCGENPNPCLTPLFVMIGSDILPAMQIFVFLQILFIASMSCVGNTHTHIHIQKVMQINLQHLH